MSSTGEAFADALLAAMPDTRARLAALTILAKWASCTVYIPAIEQRARRRERAAVNMLANGMDGGEAVEALRQRFGVSQRSAWRDVNAARKLALNGGTTGDEDEGTRN
jgi:hypothetical protein